MTMSKIIRTIVLGIAVAGVALFNLLSTSKSNTSIHRRLAFFHPESNRNLKTVTTLSGTTIEINDDQLTDNEEPQVKMNEEPATDNNEEQQKAKQPCLPGGHRRLGMFNPNVDASTLQPCEGEEEKKNDELSQTTNHETTSVTVTTEEENGEPRNELQRSDVEEPQVKMNDEQANDNEEQQEEKHPCLPRGHRRLGMFNPNVDASTLKPCEEEEEEKKNEEVSQTTNDETTAVTVKREEENAEPRNDQDYIRSENGFVEKAKEEEDQPSKESAVTVEEDPKQETTSEEETVTTEEVQQQPQEPKEQRPSMYQGMMDYWTQASYELSGRTTIVGLDTIALAAQNLEAKKKEQEESTATVVEDNSNGEQESAATEEDNKSSQTAAAAIVEEDNSNGEFASDHKAATAIELELEDIENKGAKMIADIYKKYGVPTTRRR